MWIQSESSSYCLMHLPIVNPANQFSRTQTDLAMDMFEHMHVTLHETRAVSYQCMNCKTLDKLQLRYYQINLWLDTRGSSRFACACAQGINNQESHVHMISSNWIIILTLLSSLCNLQRLFHRSLYKPVVPQQYHDLIGVVQLTRHVSKLPKWYLRDRWRKLKLMDSLLLWL